MAERSNAIGEITRFWLQAKYSCLIYESLPVPVRYNQSDIDFLAIHSDSTQFPLPDGTMVGSRIIVETKDEHDWEPKGKEFGQLLLADIAKMGDGSFISKGTSCKFSMLREEHFDKAKVFFGSDDFDRLFVLHAMNPTVIQENKDFFKARRIYFLTIPEIVADLYKWYKEHGRPAGLRHTMTGDIWHLLFGFCGCKPEISGDMKKLIDKLYGKTLKRMVGGTEDTPNGQICWDGFEDVKPGSEFYAGAIMDKLREAGLIMSNDDYDCAIKYIREKGSK